MLKIDLHTHSIASGHALNTVFEMVNYASQNGITHLGITDHGPSMKGASHAEYFWVSDQLTKLYNVKVFLGVEVNILNDKGEIDIKDDLLRKQKIISAGLHELTPYSGKDMKYNTRSIVKAMQNPFVKIITHPYRPEFPVDLETLFWASIETNTILELNNNLFARESFLNELVPVYSKLISLCKVNNRKIIVGSDAHVAIKIGNDTAIQSVSSDLGLTSEIILNNFPTELELFLSK
ncbi:MAG: PHP domain-containing protein [Ignavibacteria bacterium]|nr:PHP domain-containing protein [Ignavibacteria bacterium]